MDLLNKLGDFYIGLGGLGDYMVFLSTFYDKVEEASIIWIADDKNIITQFPKLKKIKNILIFTDKSKFLEFANHPNCKGTGITPKELNYGEWNKVNIFEKYGVIEFPEYVNEIETIKANPENQVGVMLSSPKVHPGKVRIITEKTMKILEDELFGKSVLVFGKPEDIPAYTPAYWITGLTKFDLHKQLQWIKGMDKFYSVDSWCKTWSALCGIDTVVYDNIYEPWYLQSMQGRDYSHYVFIDPWKKIELRQQ